jgi:hypothetical protein
MLDTDRIVGDEHNDTNQFGPRGRVKLRSITTPFLATTTGLFYMGTPRRSMLWLWVQKPNTQTIPANSIDSIKRKIVWEMVFNYYGGVGHRDYRWIQKGTTS